MIFFSSAICTFTPTWRAPRKSSWFDTMAKAKGGGRGGKAQTSSVATASASSQNGPATKRVVTDKENSIDLQNTNSAKGQRNTRGERNHREKQAKIINVSLP